jgi:anthranilate 1,2-dioxygenase small subunit
MSDMSSINGQTYDAIRALEYRYARLLDDDRLEEWPDLFVERGVYKVIPRENMSRQPALPIFFCDGRAMMVDRVRSLREANIYNLHYARHVVTNVEILSAGSDGVEVAACYTVYQTDLEGQTRLFSVGQYRDVVDISGDTPRFREKIAVVDTFNIPNLLAIPL